VKHGTALGIAGISFYAIHAGQYIARRQPEHVLWACHLGALAVGAGLLCRQAGWAAVGLVWLVVGLPLWLYDLRAGGGFLPTSLLTHVGGLALGLLAAKRLGVPKGLWWKCVAGLVPVYLASRLLTPPGANVNLAHRTYSGFEAVGYPLYVAALASLFGTAGAVLQGSLRRLGCTPPEKA
jgi:hypothetical protein